MPEYGDYLPKIQAYSAVSMTYLMNAYLEISGTVICSILSSVENKVMDILLLLENEFGYLDELSIDLSDKDGEELEKIVNNITIIINDNHVELGDNNTIKDSKLNG